ncbi:MAG: SDR family NAD(P)-dependent oxidoreductase, partial [Ilumatobacteraceae bacterium]
LRVGDGLPDHIVQASAVGRSRRRLGSDRGGIGAFDDVVRHDQAALILLAQAISSLAHSMRLSVITSGVHAVDGTEELCPERALLHGVCRVIPRELAHVRATAIDVEAPVGLAGARSARRSLVDLLAEELATDTDDDVVAYRAGGRWVRSFDPVRLPPAVAPVWPGDAVVLITGGLGGIGLSVAEGIAAEAPRATLILVGRTALPAESMWPALLADGLVDPVERQRIEAVVRIRAAGATVVTVAADITDADAMRAHVQHLLAQYGRIDTVVHSAGVLHDALIALRDPEVTSPVVEVKAKGILVLHDLLDKTPPSRWILFSSVSSILGLPGQVDYTAANAFLDAFAAKVNRDDDVRAVVVNWNAWQQVGMAAHAVQAAVQPPPRTKSVVGEQSAVELFDEIDDDGDVIACSTSFSRDRHWLLDEHVVIGGEALIPGTGYLELIRDAVVSGRLPSPAVELRDIIFLAPFVVTQGEARRLTVKLDRSSGQVIVFGVNEQDPNVTGWAKEIGSVPSVVIDLDAVRARCRARVELFDGYSDQPFLAFGPRWGVLRSVEYGDGEAVVTTSVPAEFVPELDTLWLHPAVVDMATGSAQALIPGFDQGDSFFVPLSYGRVVSRRPIPAEAVSVVRLHRTMSADIAVFDVSICDRDGIEAVHIEGFTMRRVSGGFAAASPSTTMPDRTRAFGLGSPISDALRVGMTPTEGVDALDRLLAVEVGSQVVASSVDLHRWIAKVDAEASVLDDLDDEAAVSSLSYGRPQISAAFEEPCTPIERELAKVWRELLGVDRVGRDDDFFELGGQSLVAVRLFAWIRRQFAVDMPLSTLFEAPTIAQCARVIAAQLGIRETPGEDTETNTSGDVVSGDGGNATVGGAMSVASGTAIMPKPASAHSLVAISSAGKGRPLFIVHGAGGNILFLWSLARALAGDRPIYGFQAMGVNAADSPDESLEAMAARYVRELVADHEGPYLLGGYSGGGCVTLEMSKQLQAMGAEVEHVLLFDSVPVDVPEGRPPRIRRLRNLVDNVRRSGVRTLSSRYTFDKVNRYIARVVPAFAPKAQRSAAADYALGWDHVEGYLDLFDHFTEVAKRYTVGEYDVDVTVFKASQIAPIYAWDYYWTRHIRGSLTVRWVQGNHQTMFYPANSPGLAEQVRSRLAEVDRRTRT